MWKLAVHSLLRQVLTAVCLACSALAIRGADAAGEPQGHSVSATRAGSTLGQNWPPDSLDWRSFPVDLSFLNAKDRPAGMHGFLRTSGDRLVFQDGAPARFWGTNVTANSLFSTTRENVRQQARRLARLGFNLVRLHHIDSNWVRPNIFGVGKEPDTLHLSATALESLDWWIKCLEDEGIYVWLDLEDYRQFRRGDGIEAFDEIARSEPSGDPQGYGYVNSSMQTAMRRFNEALLAHRNTFTGKRYKDDPAIVTVLLTNENDITNHFAGVLLPSSRAHWHSNRYMELAASFASTWNLPKDMTWRSWQPGPSKLFLNDLEYRFDSAMISHLRTLGVRVPMVTTSTWGSNPLFSLPSLTVGDIMDAHAYGGPGELQRNPVHAANFVSWLAAAQVAGKPLSVTEWNVTPFPVPDRGVIPLYMAASASHQGWDAVMQLAYSVAALDGPGEPYNWHAYNDPALLATLPAAALLYRRGDVHEANTVYAFAPGAKQLFDRAISPENSVALRTAVDTGRLVIALPRVRELPWLERSPIPPGARVVTDPNESLIGQGAREAVSDTGELRRNWELGIFMIDTPRTQAAMGRVGGQTLRLADVEIALDTPDATAAVQSLDGEPIAQSRSILISLGARSEPAAGNRLPFYTEPVQGRLTVRAPAGLRLFVPGIDGRLRMESATPSRKANVGRRAIEARYVEGRYHIRLDQTSATHWLTLE
jgi:hypothetical protein